MSKDELDKPGDAGLATRHLCLYFLLAFSSALSLAIILLFFFWKHPAAHWSEGPAGSLVVEWNGR